jgi:hypothetical protein
LALDEPKDSYSTFSSNSIDVSIDPKLAKQLEPMGGVIIDFVDNGPKQRGFTVSTKNKPKGLDCTEGCGPGGCDDQAPS